MTPTFRTRNRTNLIVVHCSDTPADMDIGVEEIRRWHRQRGWVDIGYHFVISRNGAVEAGRPMAAWGAHVYGRNHDTVGVCMVGGGDGENNFENDQWPALTRVVKVLLDAYPNTPIVGHCDLDKGKECPSFDVTTWADQLGFPTVKEQTCRSES